MNAQNPLGQLVVTMNRLAAEKHLSQDDVAVRARIAPTLLNGILSGSVLPDPWTFEALCELLVSREPTDAQGTVRDLRSADMDRLRMQYLYKEASQYQQAKELNPVRAPRSAHFDPQPREILRAAARVRRREPLTRLSQEPPDPILYSTAHEFIAGLNEVLIWAGEPSLRELVKNSQHQETNGRRLARSTLSAMLNASKLPKWDLVIAYLAACGVQETGTWQFVWRRIRAVERGSP
ncbi:hypothetical protein [Kitasatospora sp. NPDC057223]|uniref:hypothetical protein n=1 Tax=Kitasatospora sp. NPDC057223 TaxID=3346055 RepID=UPI0036406CA0